MKKSENVSEVDVPEIEISYTRTGRKFQGIIKSSSEVAEFVRGLYNKEIELREHFFAIYLNRALEIIGYFKVSIGGISETSVDVRIVLGTALKACATGIVLVHNHPSGKKSPSESDIKLTKKIKTVADEMGIQTLDHLIVTTNDYYSFADEGLLGISGYVTPDTRFVNKVKQDLVNQVKHDKRSIEKLAASFNIVDKTQVKEFTELAIVNRARELAHLPLSIQERYDKIVDLYKHQVNLSHRTSTSILLQQYSTPAPIGFLAGIYCGVHEFTENQLAFEPSAGNGLLTIAANPARFVVNEIDELRRANLISQGFSLVGEYDTSEQGTFIGHTRKYDAVITNPPFGKLNREVKVDDFPIKDLDHHMAILALSAMKDEGRSAIIIGGHTEWDTKRRIQAGKNRIFLNYLHSHYYVDDVINLDGHKLYSRQGTAFNVRLILIAGRKPAPEGYAPLKNPETDVVVDSFEELYKRVRICWEKPSAPTQQDTINTIMQQNKQRPYENAFQWFLYMKQQVPGTFLVFANTENNLVFGENAFQAASIFNKPIFQLPNLQSEEAYCAQFSYEEMEVVFNQLKKHRLQVAVIDTRKDFTEFLQNELEGKTQNDLGAPYIPQSNACIVLKTEVPDSMSFETQQSLELIKAEVGGDIDNYVRHRLGYESKMELCKALAAEQIDAVAMAIYNIEARDQGMIIGDQTGIGKGREAAAMIRYWVNQGYKPIFLTEKPNLFSDIYRDLKAIGSGHLVPFIVNGRESKTDVKDEDGNVIYSALGPSEQDSIFKDLRIPGNFDYVMATYSQFNSSEKKPVKPNFILSVGENNLLILDESHNASGSSNTGEFLQAVVTNSKGVVFLSATFAKRPDNMPIYAMKTSIMEANMTRDELIAAIQRGGVALQEILASLLVSEGQMIRRERSYEGVEVNYLTLDEKAQEHRAICDNITDIIRDIIAFQSAYIDKAVESMDDIAAAKNKETELRKGTKQAGVDNQPYFSKVFQIINQMLFSLKAEAVAELAIQRIKEGYKPVIAFSSTMAAFIEQMENNNGLPVGDGDLINTDFSEVLYRGLHSVMQYTERDEKGNPTHKHFNISDLEPEAQLDYKRILNKIKKVSTGISISPIDVVIQKIQEAGYTVAEVTGRKMEVQLNSATRKGLIKARKRIPTNDAYRLFNNNEVDVLMINQSGSTGASAHAIPTAKVPPSEVKPRVMIILQAELDINTEVQKRGRIHRTGQIFTPRYDYVNSVIPAEMRLMMMLQRKLKSLDANTTSNQKQSNRILDVPDFLNKYGNRVVEEYLTENKTINTLLGDPLNMEDAEKSKPNEPAYMVSGRVAILSTKMQEEFYNEIVSRYNDLVEYLKQTGEYDLEVETLNLDAETLERKITKMGKGGESVFGEDSYLEKVTVNILKKPFKVKELENLIKDSLQGKTEIKIREELLSEYENFQQNRLREELQDLAKEYAELIKNIPQEKKALKIRDEKGDGAYQQFCKDREKELFAAQALEEEETTKRYDYNSVYLKRVFKRFKIGGNILYPMRTYDGGDELIPAVFLGYIIDRKKRNPFAPSAVKLRIAVANSTKYIAIPASFTQEVNAIIGANVDVKVQEPEELFAEWEEYTRKNMADRGERYIVTGNLLQAFSDYSGKLVSYTTKAGETKKGILMPEFWIPGDKLGTNVSVPIYKALNILQTMTTGAMLYTAKDVAFTKQQGYFRVFVSASRSKGGDVYLHEGLMKLTTQGQFEKVSDRMQGILNDSNLAEFLAILQDQFGDSIQVSPMQLDMISENSAPKRTRTRILVPPNEEDDEEAERIRIAKAEVLALELLWEDEEQQRIAA